VTNPILVKPLLHLFSGEHEGAKFRKALADRAGDKSYKGKVSAVIEEAIEVLRPLNPEALLTVGGAKSERRV